MFKKTLFIFTLCLLFYTPLSPKRVRHRRKQPQPKHATQRIIIIPGTWALNNMWYRTGGFFYEALASIAKQRGYEIGWFTWSGVLGHSAAINAGKKLYHILEKDQCDSFHIIAHSRGSHVGVIASQELAKHNSQKRIKTFYMLGTPIDSSRYMPDMNMIGHVYNLFSFADIVQPVLGLYKRTFPQHDRIVNIRTILNYNEPDHYHLHDPVIGQALLSIHEEFAAQKIGNFNQFNFNNPAIIHFFTNQDPAYHTDFNQELMIMRNAKSIEDEYGLFLKKRDPSINHEYKELMQMITQEPEEVRNLLAQKLGSAPWEEYQAPLDE